MSNRWISLRWKQFSSRFQQKLQRPRLPGIDGQFKIREFSDDCGATMALGALGDASYSLHLGFVGIWRERENCQTILCSFLPRLVGVAEQLLARKLESICPRISPLFSILDPAPNLLSLFESPNRVTCDRRLDIAPWSCRKFQKKDDSSFPCLNLACVRGNIATLYFYRIM